VFAALAVAYAVGFVVALLMPEGRLADERDTVPSTRSVTA
jgi:hypothetical protein